MKTNKIWDICNQKCKSWPGLGELGKSCDDCEIWNGLSNKIKNQLEKEKDDYAYHCLTGN